MGKPKRKPLQWHPAFYAGLQIELEDEAENLIFENEHHLGTKPKQIDVLIVKKETEKVIHKNIGRFFRKHNIIEYKAPDDYLSIDDFYKVYGYACFYKADTQVADEIKIDELTLSFVCYKRPQKLISHLKKQKFEILEVEPGIYYIEGMEIPIQLILTKELPKEENLWIRNLTNDLHEAKIAKELLVEYEKHKHDNRYESVMNLIVTANRDVFRKGDDKMCEALVEIVEEIMEEKMNDKFEEGKTIGREEERERVSCLIQRLLENSRSNEIERAVTDKQYLQKLLEEFDL